MPKKIIKVTRNFIGEKSLEEIIKELVKQIACRQC